MKPRVVRLRPVTTCVRCGQPIGRNSTKYCSNECQRKAQHAAFIDRWLAGLVNGGSVGKVSGYVRRYLVETFGEQCSLCGWNAQHPLTGRVPLEVDHLNGNYADNSPANLRLLCPNCHSLTPTFKALNKGRGRPYAIVRRRPDR